MQNMCFGERDRSPKVPVSLNFLDKNGRSYEKQLKGVKLQRVRGVFVGSDEP